MMMARLDSLHMIERACWRELDLAAHSRGQVPGDPTPAHDWRVMTLATCGGGQADARSVVLRESDEARRELIFYTDSRSPKVAQIRQQPAAVLVAWSARLSWQLRLRVTLAVQTDGLEVSSRWARVKLSRSAQDYLAALPPGTPVDRYEPERGSREFFAMLTATVTELDWMELHADGHRRARLDGPRSTWLIP